MKKEKENAEQHELSRSHTKVSFIESSSEDIPPRKETPEQNPPEEIFYDDTPKIRRMQDSTRAREAERSKRKIKAAEENYTYEKERPDGEYIPDMKKYKKRRKLSRQTDVTAMATETLHLDLRDIVPVAVPPPQEPVSPIDVKPAPRAKKTSVDLRAADRSGVSPDSLDVTIRRTPEEAAEETRRRQAISDKMKLENTADIRSDINELRSAIAFRAGALMIVAFISFYLAVRYAFHLEWLDHIPENLISLMQVLLGLAAGSVCVPALKNGLIRLVQFRADTDSMAAVAWAACLMDSAIGVFGGNSDLLAHHFMPCAILVLLLHTIGKLLIIDREEANLNVAANRFDCYGLHIIEDEQRAETLARGVLNDFPVTAAMCRTDSLKDFRKYTYSADLADRFCHYAAPASCIFSLIMAVILAIFRKGGLGYAVGIFSMFSVASGCAAITFVVNLPLFIATRRLSKSGALLLGYQSVDDFYDTNSVMLDTISMFPPGSVRLQGVKMYSNIRTEETLLAGASLARYAGSSFQYIFREVLHGKEQMLFPVENYVYEDGLGICGWIHNQRVLLGTRELMQNHHIEGLPLKAREAELTGQSRNALYLSISGNLSALFVIELQADESVKFWMHQAARRGISVILHTVDPIMTEEKLAALFEVSPEMLKILPMRMNYDYEEETAPVREMSASMACTNSFSSVMQLVACTKVIRTAASAGVFIQAVTILIGLVLVMMDALLHLGMTPGWMMILQCISSLLTVLFVNIRKLH